GDSGVGALDAVVDRLPGLGLQAVFLVPDVMGGALELDDRDGGIGLGCAGGFHRLAVVLFHGDFKAIVIRGIEGWCCRQPVEAGSVPTPSRVARCRRPASPEPSTRPLAARGAAGGCCGQGGVVTVREPGATPMAPSPLYHYMLV